MAKLDFAPPIPADFIDEVLHNRPFSIMGLEA